MRNSENLLKLVSEVRKLQGTLGFAESCTGGLLSSQLTEIPGISDVYMGAVVSYSYQAKTDLLGVSASVLKSDGAVSEPVVRQMARGACNSLKVDFAAGITGIAGPTGGTVDKPVGTVWFAVKGPNFESAEKKIFLGDRRSVQQQSAEFAVEFLLNAIQQSNLGTST